LKVPGMSTATRIDPGTVGKSRWQHGRLHSEAGPTPSTGVSLSSFVVKCREREHALPGPCTRGSRPNGFTTIPPRGRDLGPSPVGIRPAPSGLSPGPPVVPASAGAATRGNDLTDGSREDPLVWFKQACSHFPGQRGPLSRLLSAFLRRFIGWVASRVKTPDCLRFAIC